MLKPQEARGMMQENYILCLKIRLSLEIITKTKYLENKSLLFERKRFIWQLMTKTP